MKISFFFAWYDFWVGFFWDRQNKVLYICPLPCCVIKLERKPAPVKLIDKVDIKYINYGLDETGKPIVGVQYQVLSWHEDGIRPKE